MKEAAVKDMDFEKASAIKKSIDVVTNIGTDLKEVLNSRLDAIRRGDTAKNAYLDKRYTEL